jgi:DNA modification methylase
MKESLQPSLLTISEYKKEEIRRLLDKYFIRDMNEWTDVNADLIITDPPFGIEFDGKPTNYHRNVENVVDGYVEWNVSEYGEKIQQLLDCIKRNLKENGQALIFSGWNNSHIIFMTKSFSLRN